jgi:hypothetical protein
MEDAQTVEKRLRAALHESMDSSAPRPS